MSTLVKQQPRSGRLAPFRGGRLYIWMALFSLAVGAASLAYPSTPSYDPFSWLIWGREILHGHLTIAGGSSWKPLPVIFTTVFALFGSAQANVWVLVGRAGFVLAVLMSCKLAVRIVWRLTLAQLHLDRDETMAAQPEPAASHAAPGAAGTPARTVRLAAALPAVVAGLIVLIGVGFAPTFPVPMMLGYSEGLAFGIMLIAFERAWDGHHLEAFALGILPALDRPETWIIWGPYGVWLLWKRRRASTWLLVLGLGALMLALWVAPQHLGGGTAHGLLTHSLNNHSVHSAATTSFPFWNELSLTLWPLSLERVEIAALLQIALTIWLLARSRAKCGGWRASAHRHGAAVAAALAGSVGFLWWLLISVETQAGFAGNPRYALLGVMLIYVSGATMYGWAGLGVARALARALVRGGTQTGAPGRAIRSWQARVAVGSVLLALVFALVPGVFTHRLPSVASVRYALRYQAQLRSRASTLIAEAGGRDAILRCGSIMTNNLEVTMIAWQLDVPIPWVQSTPALPPAPQAPPVQRGPNVIFQARDNGGSALKPYPTEIEAWERGGSKYKVTNTDRMSLYLDCSHYSGT